MSLCRENSSNDFFIFLFLFKNKENLNSNQKSEGGVRCEKILKISSRLQPFKLQCSASLGFIQKS